MQWITGPSLWTDSVRAEDVGVLADTLCPDTAGASCGGGAAHGTLRGLLGVPHSSCHPCPSPQGMG